MPHQSISTNKHPEKVASFKPEKRAYTPEKQKLGELEVINKYLDRRKKFSIDESEKRRQHLKNVRNLNNFALALMPIFANIYDQVISNRM